MTDLTDTPATLISQHFQQIRAELLLASTKFGMAKHTDIKGYGREALAREFLKSHLPKLVDYFTGEIIDPEHNRSSQMDLILYGVHCPKLPLIENFHLAFIDAVMAAIEVKSRLNSKAIKEAMAASRRLKEMRREELILGRNDTADRFEALKSQHPLVAELDEAGIQFDFKHEERTTNLSTTPYIVFAYRGDTVKTVLKNMQAYCTSTAGGYSPAQYGPDLIINLERGYYIYKNDDFLWPTATAGAKAPYGVWFADTEQRKGDALAGLYMYLSNLSTAFLLRPPLINLNEYFTPKKPTV